MKKEKAVKIKKLHNYAFFSFEVKSELTNSKPFFVSLKFISIHFFCRLTYTGNAGQYAIVYVWFCINKKHDTHFKQYFYSQAL